MVNLNAIGWTSINVRASLLSLQPLGSVAVTTLKAEGHAADSAFATLQSKTEIGPDGLLALAVPPFSVAHAEVHVHADDLPSQ